MTTRALIALLIAAAIVLGTMYGARAHEFYDAYCCNENDCAPYEGVVETRPDGFFLPEFNQLIPYKEARYNVPGDDAHTYHLCEWPRGTVRCFYARPGGM